jgi:broad-specificity NMP kinase
LGAIDEPRHGRRLGHRSLAPPSLATAHSRSALCVDLGRTAVWVRFEPEIVWINGTFGVGKTTTAKLISDRTSWRMFDPEHVGYLLAGNLRDLDFDDFQDLPPWRALVPAVADEIYRYTNSTAMVAVQTVLVEDYWVELITGLTERGLPAFHVLLDCEEEELRRRVGADEIEEQALEWRLDHIADFGRARDWLTRSADLVIDTTDRPPDVVAQLAIDAAEQVLSANQ